MLDNERRRVSSSRCILSLRADFWMLVMVFPPADLSGRKVELILHTQFRSFGMESILIMGSLSVQGDRMRTEKRQGDGICVTMTSFPVLYRAEAPQRLMAAGN